MGLQRAKLRLPCLLDLAPRLLSPAAHTTAAFRPVCYRSLKLHLMGPVSLLEAPAAGKVAS